MVLDTRIFSGVGYIPEISRVSSVGCRVYTGDFSGVKCRVSCIYTSFLGCQVSGVRYIPEFSWVSGVGCIHDTGTRHPRNSVLHEWLKNERCIQSLSNSLVSSGTIIRIEIQLFSDVDPIKILESFHNNLFFDKERAIFGF